MASARRDELAYWITERDAMSSRKLLGPPTWKYGYSDDYYMGTVRYCNVRREDDKVTRWLAVNWRPKYHATWELLLARMINNIPTLEKMIGHMPDAGSARPFREKLKEWRKTGPIFGNAYTVSTNGREMDKVDYIIDVVLDSAWHAQFRLQELWDTKPTLAQAAVELEKIEGVGSFMAGQLIADMKNTAQHELAHAKDWHTWAAPGPGSLRGLSAYHGVRVTPGAFTAALEQAYGEVKPLLPVTMHMQDFQNCMCEFSKFMRVKEGGHVRNRYSAR